MHIPIIGNGDVCTPERAKECFDRYGVDAIMVGRATFGAPWLFAEMKEYLSTNPVCQSEGRSVSEAVCTLSAAPPRSMEEKVAVLKEHEVSSIRVVILRRRLFLKGSLISSKPALPSFVPKRWRRFSGSWMRL